MRKCATGKSGPGGQCFELGGFRSGFPLCANRFRYASAILCRASELRVCFLRPAVFLPPSMLLLVSSSLRFSHVDSSPMRSSRTTCESKATVRADLSPETTIATPIILQIPGFWFEWEVMSTLHDESGIDPIRPARIALEYCLALQQRPHPASEGCPA